MVNRSRRTAVKASATPGSAFKQELIRRIAFQEDAARRAESAHVADADLSRIYVQLGLLYQDAAQWDKSEAVLEHAVSLRRRSSEPNGELAAVLSQLACLHVMMGKLRESEKEDEE